MPMNNTNTPANVEDLQGFLMNAARDASGRAGDPFNRTPLTTAFAVAELDLIAKLRDLVAEDEDARAFVRRWQTLVETTDEYPQRRGARLPSGGGWQWTIGAQLLRVRSRCWMRSWRDEAVVTGYRVLGTVVED